MIEEKINELIDKNNTKAFKTLEELELYTVNNNDLYRYFDFLLNLIKSNKTFIRTRGFRLICALSKWDNLNKIDNNINLILSELDDETGTSIRYCLQKLNLILMYKPNLSNIIEKKLLDFNFTKHKYSMQNLIKKDIDNILKNI